MLLFLHGHIEVNGRRVDIPSFRVRKGDVVTLSPKAAQMIVIQHNIDVLDRSLVGWLEFDPAKHTGKLISAPDRADVPFDINEAAIIEFYSQKL